jgi:hypothetical protein
MHSEGRNAPQVDLERLTIPLYIAPTDQRAPQIEKRLVNIVSSLVTHLQLPSTVEPRECACLSLGGLSLVMSPIGDITSAVLAALM